MRAIIEIDVPDYQIGQEVSIYFKDTMMIKGIVQEPKTIRGLHLSQKYRDWLFIQEPKAGHWIANAPQYDMLNPQYICSECGNAHTRTTPYCEMCGAKMVEPQERSEE